MCERPVQLCASMISKPRKSGILLHWFFFAILFFFSTNLHGTSDTLLRNSTISHVSVFLRLFNFFEIVPFHYFRSFKRNNYSAVKLPTCAYCFVRYPCLWGFEHARYGHLLSALPNTWSLDLSSFWRASLTTRGCFWSPTLFSRSTDLIIFCESTAVFSTVVLSKEILPDLHSLLFHFRVHITIHQVQYICLQSHCNTVGVRHRRDHFYAPYYYRTSKSSQLAEYFLSRIYMLVKLLRTLIFFVMGCFWKRIRKRSYCFRALLWWIFLRTLHTEQLSPVIGS